MSLPTSMARRLWAGLQAGDVFVAVDDRQARDFKSVDSLPALCGEEAQDKVKFTVLHQMRILFGSRETTDNYCERVVQML